MALSERLEHLEKRVDVLQDWVLRATDILGTQQSEVKEAKGVVKEFKTALESLQTELHTQREQQTKRDENLAVCNNALPPPPMLKRSSRCRRKSKN